MSENKNPHKGSNFNEYKFECLMEDAKKLLQALKFYTLSSNYSIVDERRNYNVDYKCYELNEMTYDDEEIGTRARKTLEEFKANWEIK